MIDTDQVRIARRRVRELRDVYLHLLIYVFVNVGLFVVDAIQGGSWWVHWVAIGWGIGLLSHAFAVFFGGRRLAAWEERKLEQFLEEATDEDMEPIGAGARTVQHPLI